jgi:hypothetical protein
MTLVYRLLGAAARIGQRLSLIRINFVPLNLALMVGLVALVLLGANETRDAVVNGNKPRVASVSEVLAHKNTERNYITVKGVLIPVAVLQKTRKSKYATEARVESSYLPMIDPLGMRALLVKWEGDQDSQAEPKETEITGMLVPLEDGVRAKLEEMGGKIDEIPFDMEYMLVQGRAPGNGATWAGVTAVSALLLALFGITFLNKYVVFQRAAASPMAGLTSTPSGSTPSLPPVPVAPTAGGPPPIPTVSAPGIDLRVTGRFTLDEKNAQRFLNVPAGLVKLDTGEIALFSNIDASNRFMGFTTADRQGMWAIVLQPASLGKLETGYLYDGLAQRPAFRIHYADAYTGAASNAILSCASESEREMILSELNQLAGYSLART